VNRPEGLIHQKNKKKKDISEFPRATDENNEKLTNIADLWAEK
jgi:hypothetical protein